MNILKNIIQKLPWEDAIFLKIMFGIMSISIFALIVSIIFVIYRVKDTKSIIGKLRQYNEKMYDESLKKIQKNKSTKTFYEYIDLLLSRSQVKYQFHFNFWTFVILTLLFFFFGLYSFIDITNDYISSLIAGVGFGFIPYVFLEILATAKSKQTKNQILTLIPVLINNAKLTNGDVYHTIKRSCNKVKPPLRIYLEEFCDEYEAGLNIEKCFDNLKEKVVDYRFTRLIDALQVHLYKGGNMIVTLSTLQKEYLAREIEEDRRKKETFSNVVGIYICVFANILIVYLVSLYMPEVIVELHAIQYKRYILLSIINVLISLFIAFKATRVGTIKK